ncbi:hypothetical protein RUND412_001935 [Rhizina undulata]
MDVPPGPHLTSAEAVFLVAVVLGTMATICVVVTWGFLGKPCGRNRQRTSNNDDADIGIELAIDIWDA